MAYTDDYVKTNWANKPATNTPINQTNLNHMEQGIKNNCGRVANLSTTKAEQSDLLVSFKNVTFDSTTGTFTFTKFDNTTITVNTDLEKLAVNFDYDDDPTSPHYQNLVITLSDGTKKYADLSALITQYEFTNTSTISFTIGTGGVITANVIDGSITADKLQPNFLADCQAAKTDAENAANAAESDALKSEGYAKGTQNGQPVGPTGPGSEYYENNAEYFKNQAAQIVNQSLAGLNDVTISAPTNGQILKYNAATQKWENTDETVGIAPDNVSGLNLVAGNEKVTITWSDPDDTVVEGQTICAWSKTKLVMKVGSYPTNVDDGTLILTNSVRNQYSVNGYEVTGLTNGTTYYFQLFPISDGNAVNNNAVNRISGTPASSVQITLTIVGAKEDTITIKNSNNELVGTCVFDANATQGTFTTIVPPTYSDNWSFTSAVAKSTSDESVAYSKTVAIDGTLAQTVRVMPDKVVYWYGYGEDNVAGYNYRASGNTRPAVTPTVTKNKNTITFYVYNSNVDYGCSFMGGNITDVTTIHLRGNFQSGGNCSVRVRKATSIADNYTGDYQRSSSYLPRLASDNFNGDYSTGFNGNTGTYLAIDFNGVYGDYTIDWRAIWGD